MFDDDATVVRSILDLYETLWKSSIGVDLLYEDNATDKTKLQVVSNEYWRQIIQQLERRPELMRSMPPRKFEELVAELLVREGLRVTLTPQVRDGGRDILAALNSPTGEHLYLVECKRYSQDRPVGVELVRQLYGVVEIERATAGLLVTTSSFTAGAVKLQNNIAHRISLRDYDGLVTWIKKLAL